jgi:hypothetical protein
MESVIKKPEAFEISDEERAWLLDRRAAAAANAPVKVADITAANLSVLSRAEIQNMLDRLTAGNIE